MTGYFVYIIKSQNRLLIVDKEIVNEDYHMLINVNGGNDGSLIGLCKMFCVGYIYGSISGKKPINSVEEFQ